MFKSNGNGHRPSGFALKQSGKPKIKPKPAPIPDDAIVAFARLAEVPSDIPQAIEKDHKVRGKVRVTTYPYSDTQWVERVEWDDAESRKGYHKDVKPWHKDGTLTANKKGDLPWNPYRFDEVLAAAEASGARFALSQEGEKSVELGRAINLASFTFQGSCWGKNDVAATARLVKERGLIWVHLADNDDAGLKKGQQIQAVCETEQCPYILISAADIHPEIENKGDIEQILEAMSAEEFADRLIAVTTKAIADRIAEDQKKESETRDLVTAKDSAVATENDRYMVTNQAARIEHHLFKSFFNEGDGDYRVINEAFHRRGQGVWDVVPNDEMRKIIAEQLEKCYKLQFHGDGTPERLWIFGGAAALKNSFDYNRSRLTVTKLERPIEAEQRYIGFLNGVLDIQENKLIPHDDRLFLTSQIQADYAPNKECPEAFLKFVERCYGLDQLESIRAAVRYCIDLSLNPGKFILLLGKSRSGKGLLLRLIASLHGRYYRSINDFGDLATREGRYQSLTGARLVGFPDITESISKMGAFYELVDNGRMSGRALFSNDVIDRQWNVRFILASVDMPRFERPDAGWEGRVFPIQTIKASDDDAIDPSIADSLVGIESELISWAMSMSREDVINIMFNPRQQSPAYLELRDKQSIATDSIKAFIESCLAPSDEGEPMNKATLHGYYKAFCEATGKKAKDFNTFCRGIKAALGTNFEEGRKSARVDGEVVKIPAKFVRIVPAHHQLFDLKRLPGGDIATPEMALYTCSPVYFAEGGLAAFREWKPNQDGNPDPIDAEEMQMEIDTQEAVQMDIDQIDAQEEAPEEAREFIVMAEEAVATGNPDTIAEIVKVFEDALTGKPDLKSHIWKRLNAECKKAIRRAIQDGGIAA